MTGGPRTARPRALLVTGDPSRHRETTFALARRGMTMVEAQNDSEVEHALALRPLLVLVDLTSRAALSRGTVARINRLRGRALVMALHEGTLGSAAHAYADLSVDGFCLAGGEGAGSLSEFVPGPDRAGSWQHVH